MNEISRSFPRRQARTRRFTLGAPRDFRVATDGRRVSFLRSSGPEDPVNRLWVLDTATGSERLVADPDRLAGSESGLPSAEKARRERVRESAGGIVAYDTDPALTAAVFTLGGSLWRADLDTGSVTALAGRPGAFDPRISPDGRRVAYGAGSGLRVVDADGDRVVICEPGPTVTWGRAEFVAAEEMGRTRGHWWSPDSRKLAVQRVDEAEVQSWWIPAPVDPHLTPTEIRYPVAGTANASVTLAIFDIDDESRVDVDWAHTGFEPAADGSGAGDATTWEYLAAVDWTGEGLFLVVQARDQKQLAVVEVDPSRGACRQRYRVTDDCWVELVAGACRPVAGRLITVEDRGSARRLCADGVALTSEAVQVRRVVGADETGVVITASSVDPAEVNVARVSWTSEVTWLTEGPGVTDAVVGGATTVLVQRSLRHPGSVVVVRSGDGQNRTVANYAAGSGLDMNVEIVSLGSRSLVAAVLMPAGADPESPWPVLVDSYGGPHVQRVQRSRALFETSQWFADQGFAVVVIDGRGTPGRGPAFERAVRGDLAAPVLQDQIEALQAAAARDPRLDLTRVAIRGWSFGGYLAALAVLRRPDVFHAAIAGAPVTDWRLYDTHYTERYLGHPATEPGNYDRTDLTSSADGLQRPLMLIHGLADDNVVAAHTLRLSRALLEAGRAHTVLPLSGVTHMTPPEQVAESLLLLELDFLRTVLPPA